MKKPILFLALLALLGMGADASRPILFPPSRIERYELAIGWNWVGWVSAETPLALCDLTGFVTILEYRPLDPKPNGSHWYRWDAAAPWQMNDLITFRLGRAYEVRIDQPGVMWPPRSRY